MLKILSGGVVCEQVNGAPDVNTAFEYHFMLHDSSTRTTDQFCGTADFNCDGDFGTDADITAFFACLAGQCPALPCGSHGADFNGDGDTGTDADIEAFFRILAGGHC